MPAPDPELRRQILNAFSKSIEPVPISMAYRLGLFLVAVVMALLPLVYLGMVVAVAYGLYVFAVDNPFGVRNAGARDALFLYVAPLAIGGILLLFMVKPLFAPRRRDEEPIPLDPAHERTLYPFVKLLASSVGAPEPSEIRVDLAVNASASYRSGFWGMLKGDLVLTIGLPLAAGLSLQQLAGVLAHELGHFAQGAGMRLTFVIRSVSFWFARVVYERDAWDAWLQHLSGNIDFRIGWILWLARLFVWLTRRVLWVLMWLGQIISSLMLRQMEYDADRYEARVAGSAHFAATSEQMLLLQMASNHVVSTSLDAERSLVDNLPVLFAATTESIPHDVQLEAKRELRYARTGWLDTHPSLADRVANVKQENAPGIFKLTSPARDLFASFDALCRAKTYSLYTHLFGEGIAPESLVPVDSARLAR